MARNEKVVRRMLTTEEAAAYLGTTERHVRRLVSDHELSRYKVGGRNRFADVDLDAWLDARRIEGGVRRQSASRVAGR
ncbi:MAG: helix-turn-helix domain-containing protein [Actinomycetota bacterium]|nr:helix-turn-helix domain-containing protein [Actinomycetota bacterium]